ncbi:MAG: glutamate--tRNA ligase [bacterium]|nr:glutamate--tRNA ligase [bacterium]
MKDTRTRFAPSPTGYIHVGNVRSALYPYLIAKQTGGKFVLRIEDTDQARFVEGAEDLILETLKWLGLDWDEGPIYGEKTQEKGDFGPYHQTERREKYLDWAQKLIEKGLAYADPYSPEEVQAFREQAKAEKRAFLYRDHRPENPPKWEIGMPLRFKTPEIKRYTWHDAVMGELSAGAEALDDFILIKADGLPTYNFAHIVDDFEMGITHVIRGSEYVASVPKYLSLYEALEIEPPVLAHLPHILAPEGNKKLGKRDGAKSVSEYREDGILPEAMLNFLAQLGWNDGTEQEIFTKEELIEKFSLERVQKSGARFDEQRLLWLNGQWIRRISLDDLFERVQNFWGENAQKATPEFRKEVLALVFDRLKTLKDLPIASEYFFAEQPADFEMISKNKQLKKFEKTQLAEILRAAISKFENLENWNDDEIQNALNELLAETGQKPGILFQLIRICLTWAPFSPALNQTLRVIGQRESIKRLKNALSNF